jgi:hypothetical protein
MSQFDSPGNEMSEEVQYDLAGNPLPVQARQTSPPPPAPTSAYPMPSPSQQPGPSGPPYGAPSPGAYPPPPSSQYAPPIGSRPGGYGPTIGVPGQREEKSKVGLIIALIAAFVVILVIIFLAKATKPHIVKAPATYDAVDCPDKTFSCKAPAGWHVTTIGVEGSTVGRVIMSEAAAKITVSSDMQASFMADGWRSPTAPPGSVVMHLHKWYKENGDELPGGYADQPPSLFQSGVSGPNDSCATEWTGDGGLIAGKLHGYRVTMIGHDRVFTVLCQCPESNWSTLKGAFVEVINSVIPGPG